MPSPRSPWGRLSGGRFCSKINFPCRVIVGPRSLRKCLDVYWLVPVPPSPLGINFAAFTIQMDAVSEELQGLLDTDADDVPALAYMEEGIFESDAEDCERAITGSVRFISSLSCVDGLILATPELAIKGFGVEIRTKKEPASIFISTTAEPHKRAIRRVDPSHYGTRHRSMMRYCFANPKSVGFVISQDGEIRAMTRVGGRLIMWENLKVLSYLEMGRTKRPRKKKKLQTEE
jgi:hypothetical protein